MPDKKLNPLTKPDQYFKRIRRQGFDLRTSTPEVDKELNKYDYNLRPEISQEANRGFYQPTSRKWLNGFVSRGLSIGTKIGEGFGYAVGAVDGLANWDASKIWNNGIAKAFHSMDEGLKKEIPVYNQRQYLDGNLLAKMGTPEFWASDAFDGIAFMTSAMVPGAVFGRLATATKALKTGQALTKATQGFATVYNTVSESGFEAAEAFKELEKAYLERGLDPAQAKAKASEGAARIFRGNMAALWAPNYVQSKWFHPDMSTSMKQIKAAAREGGDKLKEVTSKLSISRAAATGILSEGFWEENVQTAMSQYERELATGMTEDDGFIAGTVYNMGNNAKGFAKAFTVGTKAGSKEDEGATAIFLGALLGAFGSARGAMAEKASTNKAVAEATSNFERIKNAFVVGEKLYQDSMDFISNNKDEQIQQKLLMKTFTGKHFVEHGMLAALHNSPNLNEANRNFGASARAWDIANNIPGIEQEDIDYLISDTQDPELVKKYIDLYNENELDTASNLEHSTDLADNLLASFIKRTSFYIKSKIKALESLPESESTAALIQQEKLNLDYLRQKKGGVRKEFKDSLLRHTALSAKLNSAVETKDKFKYDYLLKEQVGIDVSKNKMGFYSTYFNTLNPLIASTPMNELQKIYSSQAGMHMGREAVKGMDAVEGIAYAKANQEQVSREMLDTIGSKIPTTDQLLVESDNSEKKLGVLKTIKSDLVAEEQVALSDQQILNAGIDPELVRNNPEQALTQVDEMISAEGLKKRNTDTSIAQFDNIQDSLNSMEDLVAENEKNEQDNIKLIEQGLEREKAAYNFLESYLENEIALINDYERDPDGFLIGLSAIAESTAKVDGLLEVYKERDDLSDKYMKKSLDLLNEVREYMDVLAKAAESSKLDRAKMQAMSISNRVTQARAGVDALGLDIKGETIEEIDLEIEKSPTPIDNTSSIKNTIAVDLRNFLKANTKTIFSRGAFMSDDPYFSSNPKRFIYSVLTEVFKNEIKFTDSNITPIRRYSITRDIDELRFNLIKENFKSFTAKDKEVFEKIMNSYDKIVGIDYLELVKNSKITSGEIASTLLNDKDKKKPNIQQRLAIFDGVRNILRGNLTVVQGIYGSGKTQLIAGRILKVLFQKEKTSVKDTYSIGHSKASSEVISKALGTQNKTVQNFLTDNVKGIKYLVIDEAYAFYDEIFKAVVNKAKANNIKVIALGDPSQVTTSKNPQVSKISQASYRDTNPVSVVMRTAIRPIASLAGTFQYNPYKVGATLNETSEPIDRFSGNTIGTYSGTREQIQDLVNKDTGRTKLIIVNSEIDKNKYKNPFGLVVTYGNAQGLEADEVYIDMESSGLDVTGEIFAKQPPMKFNSAMAMSISRGKQFVFTVPNDFLPSNKVNEELSQDKGLYDQELEQNKADFAESMNRYLENHVPTQKVIEPVEPLTEEKAEIDDKTKVVSEDSAFAGNNVFGEPEQEIVFEETKKVIEEDAPIEKAPVKEDNKKEKAAKKKELIKKKKEALEEIKELEEEKAEIYKEIAKIEKEVSVDKIIEEEVTDKEIQEIAKEEGLGLLQEPPSGGKIAEDTKDALATNEEVKKQVKEKIKEEVISQMNKKTTRPGKSLLKRVAHRIKKILLNLMIAVTLFNATSFTHLPSETSLTYDNAQIENLQSFDNIKLSQDELNKKENIDIISTANKDNETPYVIVDKSVGLAHIYKGDSLVTTFDVGVGSVAGDAQTQLKSIFLNKKGRQVDPNEAIEVIDGIAYLKAGFRSRTDWSGGNKSTGAGIFKVNKEGKYKGKKAFYLENERGAAVSMALHKVTGGTRKRKINDSNPNNNRITNGCVNFNAHDLEIASEKGIGEESNVYVLPDNDHNKFKIVDGKLTFQSKDTEVNRSLAVYEAQAITVKSSRGLNESAKEFTQTLADSKAELMALYPTVSNDVYNRITKIAYGTIGQETSFGRYGKVRGQIGRVTDFAQVLADEVGVERNPSVGLGQIRLSTVTDKIRLAFDINTSNDLLNPIKNAQAVMGSLLDAYVNQVKDSQKENLESILPVIHSNQRDLVAKANRGEDISENTYVANVNKYADELGVYTGINEQAPLSKRSHKSSSKENLLLGGLLLLTLRRKRKNNEISDEDTINQLRARLSEIDKRVNELNDKVRDYDIELGNLKKVTPTSKTKTERPKPEPTNLLEKGLSEEELRARQHEHLKGIAPVAPSNETLENEHYLGNPIDDYISRMESDDVYVINTSVLGKNYTIAYTPIDGALSPIAVLDLEDMEKLDIAFEAGSVVNIRSIKAPLPITNMSVAVKRLKVKRKSSLFYDYSGPSRPASVTNLLMDFYKSFFHKRGIQTPPEKDWFTNKKGQRAIDWGVVGPKLRIKTFTSASAEELSRSGREFEAKLKLGVPYLIIDNPKSSVDQNDVPSQFIRLEPPQLSSNDESIQSLTTLRNSIAILANELETTPEEWFNSEEFIETLSEYASFMRPTDTFEMEVNPEKKDALDKWMANKGFSENSTAMRDAFQNIYGVQNLDHIVTPKEFKTLKANDDTLEFQAFKGGARGKMIRLGEDGVLRVVKTKRIVVNQGPASRAFASIGKTNSKVKDQSIRVSKMIKDDTLSDNKKQITAVKALISSYESDSLRYPLFRSYLRTVLETIKTRMSEFPEDYDKKAKEITFQMEDMAKHGNIVEMRIVVELAVEYGLIPGTSLNSLQKEDALLEDKKITYEQLSDLTDRPSKYRKTLRHNQDTVVLDGVELDLTKPEHRDKLLSFSTYFNKLIPTKISVELESSQNMAPEIIVKSESEAEPSSSPEVREIKAATMSEDDRAKLYNQIAKALGIDIEVAKSEYGGTDKELQDFANLLTEDDSYFNLTSTVFDWTIKGRKISKEEAVKLIKKALPGIEVDLNSATSQLKFFKRILNNPNIWGRVSGGVLALKEEDGTVFDQVVRHEVFHMAYKYLLSNRERNLLAKSITSVYGNGINVEEALAEAYQIFKQTKEHKKGLLFRTRKFIEDMGVFFGIVRDHKRILDRYFNYIESGIYDGKIVDSGLPSSNFNFVRYNFKSVRSFRMAKNKIKNELANLTTVGLNGFPLSRKEAQTKIKDSIVSLKNSSLKLKNKLEKTRDMLQEKNGQVPEVIEMKLTKVIEDFDTYNTMLLINPKTRRPIYDEIVQDFYNVKILEGAEEYDFEDKLQSLEDESQGIKNETQDPSNIDYESKISHSIKDFLSFIPAIDNTEYLKSGVSIKTQGYLSPRFAFVKFLQIFQNIDLNNIGTLLTQIAEFEQSNSVNAETRAALDHLIDTVNNALNPIDTAYTFSSETKDLSLHPVYILEGPMFSARSPYMEDLYKRTHIAPEELAALYKQHEAINTLKELQNILGSMKESEYYILKYNRTGSMYSFNYLKGTSLGVSTSIKSHIIQKTTDFISSDEFRNPGIKIGLKKLIEGLESKDKKAVIAAYKALFSPTILNMSSLFEKSRKTSLLNDAKSVAELVKQFKNINKYDTIEDWAADNSSRLNTLTRILSDSSNLVRNPTVVGSKGKMYIYHARNYIHQVLHNLQRYTLSANRKAPTWRQLPEYLQHDYYKYNPFVNGQNVIHSLPEHDSMSNANGYSAAFLRMNKMQFTQVNFVGSFLSIANTRGKKLKYIQYLYQQSNKPRPTGAMINVLKPAQLKEQLTNIVEQFKAQPSLQGHIKKYKDDTMVNMAILEDIDMTQPTDKIVEEAYEKLSEGAKLLTQQMIEEKVALPDNLSDSAFKDYLDNTINPNWSLPRVTKTQKVYSFSWKNDKQEYSITEAQLLPLVDLFFKNYYINGFFLNQIVAGSSQFYNSGKNQVKRMSGPSAPGHSPLVGLLGTKETFKVAIVKDKETSFSSVIDKLSKIVHKKIYFELTDEEKVEIDELKRYFSASGFEETDAQGFVSQARFNDLKKGYGRGFKLSTVMKPVYFGIDIRPIPREDAEGNITYEDVPVPTYLKYSSVVLTEVLMNRFPSLRKLNSRMAENEVGELIFDSGNKIGNPANRPEIQEFENGLQVTTLELRNENFKIQLNPRSKSDSGVALPTQLVYFHNVMGTNDAEATEVFESIGEIFSTGLEAFKLKTKNIGSFIKNAVSGGNDERLGELIEEGISINNPVIERKAIIHLASGLEKETTRIKFDGGKFILQTAYGSESYQNQGIKRDKPLEYYINGNNQLIAEVIVPKGFLPKDIERRLLAGEPLNFEHPLFVGFRIPSTELHSAIAIHPVGVYDAKGTNVVIAPDLLVALHGSDHDGDSLSVLKPSRTKSDVKVMNSDHLLNTVELLREIEVMYNKMLDENEKYVDYEILSMMRDSVLGVTKDLESPKTLKELNDLSATEYEQLQKMANEGFKASKAKSEISYATTVGLSWTGTEYQVADEIGYAFFKLYNQLAEHKAESKNLDYIFKLVGAFKKKGITEVVFNKDHFVGHSGKDYKFDDNDLTTIEALIDETYLLISKYSAYKPVVKKLEKQLKQLLDAKKIWHKNNILNVMAKTITADKNLFRMLTPISMEPWNGVDEEGKYVEGTIYDYLQKGGFLDSKKTDLSDFRDAYDAYKSVSDGGILTGVFANDIKVLAYIIRSGSTPVIKDLLKASKLVNRYEPLKETEKFAQQYEDAINERNKLIEQLETSMENADLTPMINDKYSFNYNIGGETVTFNQLKQTEHGSDTRIWDTLDSFVNVAIDNVKEQILPKINANSNNGNAYIAMLGLGFPLVDSVLLMVNPAIRELNKKSKIDPQTISKLKAEIKESFLKRSKEELIEDAILSRTDLKDNFDFNKATTDQLQIMYTALQMFEKMYSLGENLRDLSSFLNVLRVMPVVIEDIDKVQSNLNSMGQVFEDVDNTMFSPNANFGYDIPLFLQKNPHLKSIYSVFKYLTDLVNTNFHVHSKTMREFTNSMDLPVILDRNKAKSAALIRREIAKYLMASIIYPKIKDFKYTYKNKKGQARSLAGTAAFSQQFTDYVIQLKDLDEKMTTQYGGAYQSNLFLQNLSVDGDKGRRTVRFTNASNASSDDIYDFQRSFELLSIFEIRDGQVVASSQASGTTNLQEMFVDYAAMNFGFSYATSNYGFALPAYMHVNLSSEFDTLLEKFVSDANYRDSIKDHIAINIIIQNSESLDSYVKFRQADILPKYAGSEDNPQISEELEDGTIIYFDVAYPNPYASDYNTRKEQIEHIEKTGSISKKEFQVYKSNMADVADKAERFFPKYITSYQKRGNQRVKVVYRRINSEVSPTVYYQRIGSSTTSGFTGWNRDHKYTIEKYFDPTVYKIYVDDNTKSYVATVRDLSKLEGEDIVLVNKSDITSQDGRLVTLGKNIGKEGTFDKYEVTDSTDTSNMFHAKADENGRPDSALDNRRRISKAIGLEAKDTITSTWLINKLLTKNISPDTRRGLEKLKKFKSVPVLIQDILYDKKTNSKLLGMFAEGLGVSMSLSTESVDAFAKTFLHELIHAYTLPLMKKRNKSKKEKDIVDRIEALYERALEKLPSDARDYGLTNVYEFVAETFSDPAFRTKLSKIPLAGAWNSVLKYLQSLLSRLFGINPSVLDGMFFIEKDLLTDAYSATLPIHYFSDTMELFDIVTSVGEYIDIKNNLIEQERSDEESMYQAFVDPSDIEEDGDTYIYKKSTVLQRVSDTVTGGVSWFRKNIKPIAEATQIADDYWGKLPKTESLPTTFGSVTHAQYIAHLEANFEKGKAKGNIIHELIRKMVTGMSIDLSEMYARSGYTPESFNWITSNIKKIMKVSGINIYDRGVKEEDKDKLEFEQILVSEILKLGGRADLVVTHKDGSKSIYDFKTGVKFDSKTFQQIFKHGDQGTGSELLWDTAENRAKLQIMLYALIMKLENPETTFNNLSIIWLPHETSLQNPDTKKDIQIQPFLNMIKDYLEKEKPETLSAIRKEKGEAALKDLFDSNQYKRGYSPTNAKLVAETNGSSLSAIERAMARLKHAVMYDVAETSKGEHKRKEAAKIAAQIIELKENESDLDLKGWTADLSFMSEWIGTNASVSNPFIQMYDTYLVERKGRARSRYAAKYNQFLTRLLPVYNDYLRREGKATVAKLTANQLVNVDSRKLYDWMYKEIKDEGTGEFLRYELNNTQEDWVAAKAKFPQINQDYIKFSNWVQDQYATFFEGKDALANQTATVLTGPTGFVKNLTNLDVYNGKLNYSSRKMGFSYKRGFFPKVPKDLTEINGIGAKSKEWWTRFSSYFIEDTFENHSHEDTAIPMMYMGSALIDSDPMKFSFNVERQFDQFMRRMIFKEELDDVYSLGKGVQYYLEFEKQGMTRSANYLKTQVELQVRNRNQRSTKPEFNAKNASRIDWLKVLSSSKSLAAAPVMWFNWIGGTANGVFAYMYTHKEGLKNSILASDKGPWKGIDQNHVDFTEKDLVSAHKDYATMMTDSMQGNILKNKTYLLLKKLNYLPDNYDWSTRNSDMLSSSNKAFGSRTPYMFYSVPEEAIATMTMVAQLKSMKISDKHPNKEVAGKSLWDMYETVEITDKDGTKFTDVQWKVIDGKPIVRGLVNVGRGQEKEFKEVTELDANEIRRMYYVYERMHGGYRADEKTKLEYYVIGSLFMQFRRYMPAILRNALQSSGKRSALGYYKVKDTTETGQNVVEWHSRVMEGRWLVLGKTLLNFLAIKGKFANPKNNFQEFWNNFMPTPNESYDWNKLGAGHKEALTDAMLTLTFLFSMIGGYILIFGANFDDKDSIAKMYRRIMGDFSHQYNLLEMSKNLANTSPIVLKKNYDLLSSVSTVMFSSMMYVGGDEDQLTQDGVLRGWNSLQRDLPFLSAIRKTNYFWEELDEDWTLFNTRTIK